MKSRWICVWALGALVAATSASAQVSTSQIVGTVSDKTGAVVAGAKVAVTNEATGVKYETTTTETGAYAFTALTVGYYTISVEASGFQKWVSTKNLLQVGAPIVVDATLEVGAVTSVVQVESTYERLATSNAMISDVVDRRAVRDLPLNGRNPLNLITLQPGLIQRSTGAAGSGTHINGSRDRAFNVTLDGIDLNEPSVPNPQSNVFRLTTDNVQEYRIVTHNATAEFGRNSGANIALASRAGTNELHGNLYDYWRNPILNAADWFVNAQGGEKPDFKIHQFGADVGGPIKKNKTHWFASYQGQRLGFTQPIVEVFGTPIVYTSLARTGLFRFVSGCVNIVQGNCTADPANPTRPNPNDANNFSRNSGRLVDAQGNLLPTIPVCGGMVTTNCVTSYNIPTRDAAAGGAGALDMVMSAYINAMPTANNFSAGGDGLNTGAFLWNPPSRQPEFRLLGRMDHQFDENNSIFVRYTWANSDTKGGDFLNRRPMVFPGFPPLGLVNRRPRNLAISYRRVFSPRLVNEYTMGFSRFQFDFLFGRANPAFPNIPPFTLPNITEPFLNQSGTSRWLTTVQFIDNLSYTRGNHLFRGGLNFRFIRHNDHRSFVGGVNNAPRVDFSAATRTVPGSYAVPSTCPGTLASSAGCISSSDIGRLRNAILEMLGVPSTVAQSFFGLGLNQYAPSGLYVRGARMHQYNLYIQDEWKFRRNLTFNLGLRWEFNQPGTESNGLILRPDVAINGSQGRVTFVKRGSFWDRENGFALAPRLGVAWDPFSSGKMVIRAGYGLSFDPISTFQMVPVLGLVPGSSAACSMSLRTPSGATGFGNPTVSITSGCPTPAGTTMRVGQGFPLALAQPTNPPSFFASPAVQSRSTAPPAGGMDPNLKNPSVHEWTLNVQREVGFDTVVQIGYLGKRGTHLFRAYDANQLDVNHDGFIQEFLNAQNNLFICQRNAAQCIANQAAMGVTVASQRTADSFGNWGLAGQVNLPLLSAILGANQGTVNAGYRDSSLVGALNFNAAGSFAATLDSSTFFGTAAGLSGTCAPTPAANCVPGLILGTQNFFGISRPNFFRPNPQFSSIFYFDSGADSYYHALQIHVRRQTRNLSYGAAYTFGKSMDNGSVDPVGATSSGAVGNNSRTNTDIRNFRFDRGRSDFDRTHVFIGHWVWDLPFGRGQHWGNGVPAALNQIIGGWTATGIVTIMSGEPWGVLSGSLTNGNIRNSRADIRGPRPQARVQEIAGVTGPVLFDLGPLITDTLDANYGCRQVVNTQSFFCVPAPGTNGNQGRNIFSGPNYWNVDLGVTKAIRITERVNLQVRAEFFNAFNHPNFDNPLNSTDGSTNFRSTLFAQTCCVTVSTPSTTSLISVGEAARVIQIAMRLNF